MLWGVSVEVLRVAIALVGCLVASKTVAEPRSEMGKVVLDHCPICRSGSVVSAYRPDAAGHRRFLALSEIKYQRYMDGWQEELSLEVRRCRRCGHHWHHTQPDQASLIGMYDASRPLKPGPKPTEPSPRMLREMRVLRKAVLRRGAFDPKLLDYGSGGGRWSRAATRVGFAVCSYEPSRARAPINGVSGAAFRVVTALDDLTGERFDAVNLEQVLEHTQDPIGTLKSLRALCHEKTVLRITVPDAERVIRADDVWSAFPFDGKTMHIMSPYEHLQGFSPRSFALALREAGLIRLSFWGLLSTHPVHAARQIVGRAVRRAQQTTAIARFAG